MTTTAKTNRSPRPSKNGHPETRAGQPSEILDKQPPCDENAEKWVVASILSHPAKWPEVKQIVRAVDYWFEPWRVLFAEIVAMDREGLPPDIGLLQGRIRGDARLQAIGGAGLILEAMRSLPTCENAGYYAKVVRDKAVLRNTIDAALEAVQAAYNGDSKPLEVVTNLQERLQAVGADRGGKRFASITCAELNGADYHLEYLVDGLLVKGQPCVLAGPKKALKTNVTIDLGISLAVGGWFLGALQVTRPVRTAIMSAESGLATIQETARRIAQAANWELEAIDNLLFVNDVPRLDSPDDLAGTEKLIRDNGLEAIALDPAYMMLPGTDAGNLFIQGQMLRNLGALCATLNCTPILVHHTRKNTGTRDTFPPPELENIAWSGFQEWARSWVLLDRRERYEPGTGLHRLWLSAGGSAGHSGLWALDIDEGVYAPGLPRQWEVRLESAESARQESDTRKETAKADAKRARDEAALQEGIKQVVRALAKFPAGMTQTAIRERIGTSGTLAKKAVAAALEAGDIEECDVQAGPQKTLKAGYRLKKDEHPGTSGNIPEHPGTFPG